MTEKHGGTVQLPPPASTSASSSTEAPASATESTPRISEERATEPTEDLLSVSASSNGAVATPSSVVDLLNVTATNGTTQTDHALTVNEQASRDIPDQAPTEQPTVEVVLPPQSLNTNALPSNSSLNAVNNAICPTNGALPSIYGSGSDEAEAQTTTCTTPMAAPEVVPVENTSSESSASIGLPPSTLEIPRQGVDHISTEMESLAAKLANANALIVTLQEQQNAAASGDDMLIALQSNLQRQMGFKAEAENKARLAEAKIQELERTTAVQAEEIAKFQSLQENLEQQMTAKAEAENKARSAFDRVQQLESDKDRNVDDLKSLSKQLVEAREALAAHETELEKVRHERNEHEQRATALTTRLNTAKKKEAVKVNLVEEFEDDLKAALDELEKTKGDLKEALASKSSLEHMLEYTEKTSQERVGHLERVLADERRLHEERKLKMKAFVEKKADELRQVKEENDSLQVELTQTNRSLVDLNNRWKQQHTQWVQAQTRNRELQRDLNRTKKDTENLHKQGDTLEMKLSRSANETEEHKNKRLAAKHELMSVLRALDAERDVSAKLRDKLRFVVTPAVQNHRHVLNESLADFEASLQKLSLRLGKPLPAPPPPSDDPADPPPHSATGNGVLVNGEGLGPHGDVGILVDKLEHESHCVTFAIAAVANNVERLQALVHASGDRTCFTVLTELVSTGAMATSPAMMIPGDHHRAAAIINAGPLASIGRSHRYGQIPANSEQV